MALLNSGTAWSQELPLLVARQGYADILLINGKIVTMDDRSNVPNTPGKIVEAMVIKGKKIMALGSNAEMRRLAGSETRFVDLGKRTVIPGLVAVKTGGTHPIFNEPAMDALSWEFWLKDEPLEKLSEALRLFGMDLQKLGITTVATPIVAPRIVAAYNRLNREGRMPHRLAYYIESQRGRHFGLRFTREFFKASGSPWTDHVNGGEMLWLNGMFNEIWDSITNEVCLGPDLSAPPEIKARERCLAPGSKPWDSYKAAILSGWRPVQAHGTSSHGVRLYLQMLEEAMKEGNYSLEYMRSLRTTLEHSAFLGNVPDVMAGIKKYGIIINVTPGRLAAFSGNLEAYGEKLKPFTMPVKTWIKDGQRVTFEANGSDFWTPIYSLMTRRFQRWGIDNQWVELLPEEGIDRVTALKMATTWASEYMMAEDTVGTLEPGKFADFAVLEKDFFTVPVEEVLNMKVVMTGLSGKIVYRD